MKNLLLLLILFIPFFSFSQNKSQFVADCVKSINDRDVCNCMVNSMFENLSAQEISKLHKLDQEETNRLVWEEIFRDSFEDPNFYTSNELQFPCANELINYFSNNTKLNSIVGKEYKDLGDYYIVNRSSKTRGLKFKIKKPFKYEAEEAQVPTTIVKFVPPNWEMGNELVTFDVALYDYEQMQMNDFRGISKREWKELCNTYGEKYFEVNGLFGWTQFLKGDDAGLSDFTGSVLATFLFLDEYIIAIRSTNISQLHTEKQKRVYYNMCKTIEFLN